MEYRVLGPFDVRRGGERLALGSFKQRSLLALLLIHANEVVSTDRIIDELWGGDAATERLNALWVHVSKLRSTLEPGRGQRSEGTLLLTRPPGYVLQVTPDEVDAWRFRQLVDEGRGLLDVDPAAASIAIAEALALWRGHPYEDFTYEPFTQAEISRLEESRLEAVELRIDADLGRGLASELVAELEGLVRQHPFREGLTAQMMVALYRSGRQAEALRAYARLRSQLSEEVGVEPSASLKRLEEQVLSADPSVGPSVPAASRQAKLAVRGYELREQIGVGGLGVTYRAYQPAVGREVAIKMVGPELANTPAFVRQFGAEAELVARLEHPHIVPIYDFWREPDAAYIVTRLFRSGTVADAVRNGPMAPPQAAQIVEDVASALALAHRSGIVHRGIEPSSILLDGEGRAYLTDFGIAGDGILAEDPDAQPTTLRGPYASPEQHDRGPVTAASDIFSLAMVLAFALSGHRLDDVGFVAADLPAAVAEVIARATSPDPRRRHPDASAFASAVHAALGSAPVGDEPAAVANPYKGLRAFEEGDAVDFSGRERLVERLPARLGGGGMRGRFLALVGPSGSGKSSLVKAGLLPALRQGALAGSAIWFIADITPGAHPFEALEAALLRIAVNPPPSLFEQLTGCGAGIDQAVRRVLPDDGSQLLLVIDQFEELYTHAPARTAQAFLEALATAVGDPSSRLRVVVTLRADFYDRPLRQRVIGELFRRGTEVVTPMTPDEIARAVTGPAERMDVRFETGVVAEIVSDIADRTGALPLLQYALTELFDRRRGRTIDLAVYREAGGASGALVRRAEALYGDFDEQAGETTRQVLLRLVTVGEGTEVFRRRIARRELVALGHPAVEVVVDTLGRHRLLGFDRDPVTREPTVEIAHEALLTEWSRLRAWIDEGSRRRPPAPSARCGRGRVAGGERGPRVPPPGTTARPAGDLGGNDELGAQPGRASVPGCERGPQGRGPHRRGGAPTARGTAATGEPPAHSPAGRCRPRARGSRRSRRVRRRATHGGRPAGGRGWRDRRGTPSGHRVDQRRGGRSRVGHPARPRIARCQRRGRDPGAGRDRGGVALGDPGPTPDLSDDRCAGRDEDRPRRPHRHLPTVADRHGRSRPPGPHPHLHRPRVFDIRRRLVSSGARQSRRPPPRSRPRHPRRARHGAAAAGRLHAPRRDEDHAPRHCLSGQRAARRDRPVRGEHRHRRSRPGRQRGRGAGGDGVRGSARPGGLPPTGRHPRSRAPRRARRPEHLP